MLWCLQEAMNSALLATSTSYDLTTLHREAQRPGDSLCRAQPGMQSSRRFIKDHFNKGNGQPAVSKI